VFTAIAHRLLSGDADMIPPLATRRMNRQRRTVIGALLFEAQRFVNSQPQIYESGTQTVRPRIGSGYR
jgi:hypothetical protein